MPKAPIPDRFRDIYESTALGHLATVAAEGRPQVNPVWFIADSEQVYLSIRPDTVKYRNIQANPHLAISISDLTNAGRYLEIRGTVVAVELYDTLAWVNHLAHKYTGKNFTNGKDGEHRYKVTIRVDSWTGQG